MAYIRSQANGNYSNPATWVGGAVPGEGDFACTLTHRITLDINPLAVLCVTRTDFSNAGGTVSAAFTGGFTIPANAVRTIVGLRFDGTSTSSTNTNTTSALVMNGLELNIGYLQVLLDVTPTSTNNQYILYVTGVASVTQIINITGSLDYCLGSGNFVSRYNTCLIYLAGVTNGNITVNLPTLSPWSPDGLHSQGMGLLATNTAASGFTFNFNASIPAAVGSIKTTNFFKCSFVTTGVDNQKVNFNAPVMGSGLAPVGSTATTIAFTTVSSVTATAPLTIDMTYETGTSSPTYATFTDIRNSVSLSDLTLLGKVGSLTFLGMDLGSTFTCGNITLSNRLASSVFLNVTGEAEITLGNISCMSDTSAYTTVLAVALTTTQKVVVGNLSYGLGNLAHQPLLKITGVLTKPITLGSIDARNLYFQANTASYSAVQINDITTDVITVNGNIYGSNFGTVSGNPGLPTSSAALNFLGSEAGNVSRVVINGDVYGGTKQSAIITYAGISTVFNITVKGKVASPSSQTVPRIPFPHPIYAGASPVAVEEIDCGNNAMFPIVGFFSFIGMHSRISMMSETFVGTNEYITARFWRILMTENNGDTYFSLQEVNIIGANNLSLVSPATPTSQSSYYDAGWYQANASKLVDTFVDGGETDVWVSSGANSTEWVSFDLTQPVAVKAFRLLPQVYAPVTVSRSPKVFKIQFSNDNVNWGDAFLAENQTNWTAGVYNEYLLPYEPNASGGTNDLSIVLQKLTSIEGKVNEISPLSVKVDAIKTQTDKLFFGEVITQEAIGDTNWDDTVLLIRGNAGTIIDEKSHTINNVSVTSNNDQALTVGGKSMEFDQTNYLSIQHSDFILGTGDFTVEFWIYRSQLSQTYGSFFSSGYYATAGGFNIRQSGGDEQIEVVTGSTNTVLYPTIPTPLNEWIHIALTREAGLMRIFVNGQLGGSVTATNNYTHDTLYLGTDGSYYGSYANIVDLRVTKLCRYTASFTPPEWLPYAPGTAPTIETHIKAITSAGGSSDLVLTKLDNIKKDTTFIKSIVT